MRGAEGVSAIVERAGSLGIRYLTLFAFSDENWGRPASEVAVIMRLIERYLRRERSDLMRKKVRFRMIGQRDRLPRSLARLVADIECESAQHDGLQLIAAISYGGRSEIVRACQAMAHEVLQGRLRAEDIGTSTFEGFLDTRGVPPPDLVVRTSGERRVSNFLLWQIAYAELYFTDLAWPDFGPSDLDDAVSEYARRERRYGGVRGDGDGQGECATPVAVAAAQAGAYGMG